MANSCKSRGSFVDHKRKSLTLNNIFLDVSQEETNTEKAKYSIKSYLESIQKEKKDWKDILREKKAKYKNFEEKHKTVPLVITEADVAKFITFDDKQFLKDRPNYLEMMESLRKYIDAFIYVSKYKSDIIDYYDKAYNELEINKKILVEKMCASDLCEICNIKNCATQEHKFID